MRSTPARPAFRLLLTGVLAGTALAGSVGLSAASGAAAGSAAAPADVPITKINPPQLPRGADVAVPHLEGKTIVDGAVEIPVKGGVVELLGTSGTSYVVGVRAINGSGGKLQRVAADGTATPLGRVQDPSTVVVSANGKQVVDTRTRTSGALRTTVTIRSSSTGAVKAARTFAGARTVLDAASGEVVLGGYGSAGTSVWTVAEDTVARIGKGSGYQADIGSDLLAAFTKDPYAGGCTVVTRLSRPSVRLSSSCSERVESFSPDGKLMTTVDKLSDGIGPSVVGVRKIRGAEVARYRSGFYFGLLQWESDQALLLDTVGRQQQAVVRCVLAVCERASDLTTPPPLKVS